MSIYTKFGDKGKTSLYGGKTVSKASLRVDAYGSIDELNSFLGVVLSFLKEKKAKKEFTQVQKDLFEIGSQLATPSSKKVEYLSKYLNKRVGDFEEEIDSLTKKLSQLENFILPGGGNTGSLLHYLRTQARKTERRVVALSEKEKVLPEILVYLNRLSDLLFMHARFINKKQKQKETLWKTR